MAVGGQTLARAVVRLEADTARLRADLTRVQAQLGTTSAQAGKTQASMAMLGKAAVGAAAGFAVFAGIRGVAAGVRGLIEFDSAMNQSLAIMGDVSETMRTEMVQAAREVSTELNFAAREGAEAFFFLASAGLDAEQSVAALPAVARFARAGMFDFATATDLATDAQSALGLTVDDAAENLRNMTRVTDVLVKANTLANATVQQFSTALTRQAGAAMKSFGIDVEEGVAVLAAFADQGVKAELAGSSLQRILTLLSNAASENADEMKKLGVAVFDETTGELRNMADVVADLENALLPMSDAARTAALSSIGFSARVQQVINPLLGTSEAIRRYEAELRKAGGTTQDVADKQMESLENVLGRVRREFENWRTEQLEKLVPAIQTVAENAGTLVDVATALAVIMAGKLLKAVVAGTAAWLKNAAAAFSAATAQRAKLQANVANTAAEVAAAQAALRYGLASTNAAAADNARTIATVRLMNAQRANTTATVAMTGATTGFAAATRALFAAIGPTGWLILGLTALVALWAKVGAANRKAAKRAKELADQLDETRGAIGELDREATKAALLGFQRGLQNANAEVDKIKQKMEDAQKVGDRDFVAALRERNQRDLEKANAEVERMEALVTEAAKRWVALGDEAEDAGDDIENGLNDAREGLEDANEALQRMIDDLSALGEAEALGLVETEDALRGLEDVRDTLQDIADDESRRMTERVDAARRVLEIEKQIAAVLSRTLEAQTRAAAARATRPGGPSGLGTTGGDFDPIFGPIFEGLAETESAFQEVLDAIGPALGGLAAITDAFIDLDQGAQRAIRGLSDVVSGLDNIMGAADEAGGFGAALGSIGGIASLLPGAGQIVGGVAQLLGGLFGGGGPSPEELRQIALAEERNQLAEENNRLVERMVDDALSASDLQFLRESSETIGTLQDQGFSVEGIANLAEQGGILSDMMQQLADLLGIELVDAAGNQVPGAIRDLLGVLGITVAQIEEAERAFMDSLEIRKLEAQGLTEEAAELRRLEAQKEQIREAQRQGFSEEAIAALQEVLALEEVARARKEAAEAAKRMARFTDALALAQAEASKNAAEIARITGRQQIDAQLEPFRKMVEAGELTQAELDKLRVLLEDDLAETLADIARQAARARRAFALDIRGREAALAGDDRGALEARLQAQAEAELNAAMDQVRAGEISIEMYQRLAAVITGEVNQALEEFEEQAKAAAEAERQRQALDLDNLRLRILVAQGKEREAQALRDQLEIQKALNDERSAEFLELLRQAQAAESARRAQERMTEAVNETTNAINGAVNAINAPTGLRLSLLRFRAATAGPSDMGTQSGRLPARATNQTNNVTLTFGDVVVPVREDDNPDVVVRKWRDAVNRTVRAGGINPAEVLPS